MRDFIWHRFFDVRTNNGLLPCHLGLVIIVQAPSAVLLFQVYRLLSSAMVVDVSARATPSETVRILPRQER
jgi:hypothetical protein